MTPAYIVCRKKPMTQENAKGELCFPTPEEMRAIEQAARRARAVAIGRLMAAAGHQLKERIHRTDAAPRTRSQFPTKRKTMTTTLFWKNALASLPPSAQRRYAATFEAAERFEILLDLGIETWGSAKHALAKICRAVAHAMRGTARILDSAAHRLLPVHRAETY
jgi:hypothetical protein